MIAVTICRYDRPQSGGRSGSDLQQSLSIRQDPVGQPAEMGPLDGPYLSTAAVSDSADLVGATAHATDATSTSAEHR